MGTLLFTSLTSVFQSLASADATARSKLRRRKLLRLSSPEFPRSPAPSATARSSLGVKNHPSYNDELKNLLIRIKHPLINISKIVCYL